VETGLEPGREVAVELEIEKLGDMGVVGVARPEFSVIKRTRWRCSWMGPLEREPTK
jgi:hypothetical protein